MANSAYPIIYVRGYAGTQSDVEETTDDPMYGFNAGSTHIRLDQEGHADFFMFVSPFARLLKDFGYLDVIDGALQRVPDPDDPNRAKTIWIYRYYDPTTKTFDRPGGRRLSIEEAAEGLREFIETVKGETGATKVILIAHSMGGLVCRSLLQRTYAPGTAGSHVDKLFTYGTPHGGIKFALGMGVIEKLRDALGVNNSNDFGPDRMYQYLTPGDHQDAKAPDGYEPAVIPPTAFDTDRIFCIVGTNASDYIVASGAAKTLVGPQSDGLVQIESAAVTGSHRAYVHRSHSGRYGMVNSEEGYQNLQRFLFGDIKVKTVLCDFELSFEDDEEHRGATATYLFETQVSVRGLPILMHERTLSHFCADALDQAKYAEQKEKGGLPLFTNFLLPSRRKDKTVRYMIRLAVYKQWYKKGFLLLSDHMERLPLWSDYLIVELRPPVPGDPAHAGKRYIPFYSWASESTTPDKEMMRKANDQNGKEVDLIVPIPAEKAKPILGPNSHITFQTFDWS